MDVQPILDIISRIVHVSTAIVLVGGASFVLFVLIPSASILRESEERSLRKQINGRWKRFVQIGVTLFLVTGFYNFIRALPSHHGDSVYHALLGTKILLAFALFFISAALVGRSTRLEFIRKKRVVWLRIFRSDRLYRRCNLRVYEGSRYSIDANRDGSESLN